MQSILKRARRNKLTSGTIGYHASGQEEPLSNLSEQEIASIVAGLVAARRITERDGEMYRLRIYGKAIEPPLTVHKLSVKYGLKIRQVNQILANILPLIVAAVREHQAKPFHEVEVREGLSEQDTPLYFGISLAKGSDAWTTEDWIQRCVVDPHSSRHKGIAA